MEDYKNILIKNLKNIEILVLNNPERLNVMTKQTLYEIKDAFNNFLGSPSKVIIITGSGKAFCAGADVSEMINLDYRRAKSYSKKGQQVFSFIESFPKPVIAALNGYTFGGGCELALACDMRIASDNLKIGQPEINLGIICGWGATHRLPRIIKKSKALRLLLSGEVLGAKEAESIGLVDKIVEKELLDQEIIKLATNLCKKPKTALAIAKKAVNLSVDNKNIDIQAEYFADCFKTDDQKEGMKAFLEKRKPVFKDR